MQTSTASRLPSQDRFEKPPILEVIGAYVQLRKAGAEYVGLCPLHTEKTASFYVNDSKGVFHCHACHAGGDVISFVQQIEGIDFKQAIARLGVESFRPSPEKIRAREQAGRIVEWAHGISIRLRAALREISDEIRVVKMACELPEADKPLLAEKVASLIRQWAILCDFDDDVNDPKLMLEMWSQRDALESLLESVE
jgi:hypothetical protein